MIAELLGWVETPGMFTSISASMVVVMAAIGLYGPRTECRFLEEIAR